MNFSTTTHLTDDSRQVQAGSIFIHDIRNHLGGAAATQKFIAMAKANGAAGIMSNYETDGVTYHAEPNTILATWAAKKWPERPQTLVGVTGTNGKTSVAWFYKQMASACDKKCGSIGTLGVYANAAEPIAQTGYTTPTAPVLHQTLQTLKQDEKCTHAALEVGSHALALHRADGVRFKAAALTNITQDHLDFHGTMDAYAAAKARLFSDLLALDGVAVLPIGRPEAWPIAAFCRANEIRTLTVGSSNAELTVNTTRAHSKGQDVIIKYGDTTHTTTLPLMGTFQAANIATTLGLGIASGFDLQQMLTALPTLTNVPGRMELVQPRLSIEATNGGSASRSAPVREVAVGAGAVPQTQAEKHTFQRCVPTLIVDYAHTADALASACAALKPLLEEGGKLITVFGAGGDRDATKRPLMAAAAGQYSDVLIITDDNPRSEDATKIRAEVTAGAPTDIDVQNISPREDAIAAAIETANEKDIILLAGKGHETGQIINGITHPFDDREIAKNLLEQSA